MSNSIQIDFKNLNHIQICIPTGREAEARAFYCGLLGLPEIEKPDDLKKNGGFWLSIAGIELHIGIEDVIAKSKRHPAFEVSGMEAIKKAFLTAGVKFKEYSPLPEYNRFSFFDPFDNRIELLERKK